MCGICGFVGKGTEEILFAMRDKMEHRGPDDKGYFFQPGIGLGHCRLSIIDLKTGHQPIHNEDKSIYLVCNGEIYNFLILRDELEKKGHIFYTNTDAEVIVHAYEEWREDCTQKLRGMFAFAIWDTLKERLFLVRDRFGIKPLYYFHFNDTLLFASEIKALLVDRRISHCIDPMALDMYLRLQFIPAPYTIFKQIQKLPSSHYLIYERGEVIIKRYWKLTHVPVFKSEAKWLDALEEKILEAVKIRLVCDVPLGVFLSGGIDSTIVVLAMKRYLGDSTKTFTIGFKDSQFDERSYAREVACLCKTNHHEELIQPELDSGLFEKMVIQLDEPMSDSSFIPTYYISKLARKNVTVVLSGDGGDETFAGYDKYSRWLNWQRRLDNIPFYFFLSGVFQYLARHLFLGRRTLMLLSKKGVTRYVQLVYNYYSLILDNLYNDRLSDEIKDIHRQYDYWQEVDRSIESEKALDMAQYVDFLTYLPEDILMKVDKMSMFNSLEVRIPLLDHKLHELVAQMPVELKWQRGISKYILKKLLERWGFSGEFIHRKKKGFAPTVRYWFTEKCWRRMCSELPAGSSISNKIFNKRGIERIIANRDTLMLWKLWVFEIWARNYLD